jgi:predicted nuclease of restriction endonuclease-like (RecB) superfamily
MKQLKLRENNLLTHLINTINEGKNKVAIQVNSTLTLVFWQVGKKINDFILGGERADYGKQIVKNLSIELVDKFGRSFASRNLHRMMQFAEQFSDFGIVVPLARQLSWSHFIILIPLKDEQTRLYYANKAIEASWGKRELRNQIERKSYERAQIADTQIIKGNNNSELTVFKDPYFLDFLGLKEGYLEKDLEAAIIKELELFILELGNGFSFIERQKRMIIDGKDFYLDLLFYHRKLKRLVAIELKLGDFKASHKGQMELYLKWLNRYEKQTDENQPIGLILCAQTSREQVELLEMHKDGIMVAEYWKDLPPKEKLEQKLHSLLLEAKARLDIKKLNE